jgi:hypothetical protein
MEFTGSQMTQITDDADFGITQMFSNALRAFNSIVSNHGLHGKYLPLAGIRMKYGCSGFCF